MSRCGSLWIYLVWKALSFLDLDIFLPGALSYSFVCKLFLFPHFVWLSVFGRGSCFTWHLEQWWRGDPVWAMSLITELCPNSCFFFFFLSCVLNCQLFQTLRAQECNPLPPPPPANIAQVCSVCPLCALLMLTGSGCWAETGLQQHVWWGQALREQRSNIVNTTPTSFSVPGSPNRHLPLWQTL